MATPDNRVAAPNALIQVGMLNRLSPLRRMNAYMITDRRVHGCSLMANSPFCCRSISLNTALIMFDPANSR